MMARSPHATRYRGMAALTDENAAFLAALCKRYRNISGLTLKDASARAATSIEQWHNAENMVSVGLWIQPTSPIRRIISLVLRVSPVCRKGESPHNRPILGVSHVEKVQVQVQVEAEAVHR